MATECSQEGNLTKPYSEERTLKKEKMTEEHYLEAKFN